jgi:hypothetical protein
MPAIIVPPSSTTATTTVLPTFPPSVPRTDGVVPRAHFTHSTGTLAEQAIIGSNWFPHSGTSAFRPQNPNVVWRRALSICCHCTRQNHLRRYGTVLNVSGVANRCRKCRDRLSLSHCAHTLSVGPVKPPAIRNGTTVRPTETAHPTQSRCPFSVRHE